MTLPQDRFGITDAAISFVEQVNALDDRNAANAATNFVARFFEVIAQIKKMEQHHEYFISLVRKDFHERLNNSCHWPYNIKDRAASVINTNSKILLKDQQAVARLKKHREVVEQQGKGS